MASEPSFRTRFRRALQEALHEQMTDESGGKFTFVGGELQGAQERDIGCVWWEQKAPHARAGILEENTFGVRVFRRFKQDQGGEEPRTMQAELIEDTAEALEAALAAVLTLPWLQTVSGLADVGDSDFFTVTQILANHEQQWVQAAIVAYATNRTSRGG